MYIIHVISSGAIVSTPVSGTPEHFHYSMAQWCPTVKDEIQPCTPEALLVSLIKLL